MAASAVFLSALFDDTFVDEYAYITQSYYSDLFFAGRRDDPSWLDDFAYDLQPLPKYFIGPGLHAAGMRMPGPEVAARWYRNAHTRFGTPATLTIARLPFIGTAVLGCLALFGVGSLVGGRGVGAIAAVLLILNPLYRLHAHRAMSDVPCEAFMIAALGLALRGASRIWAGRGLGAGVLLFTAAGVCSGLSICCKLNGLLAPIVIMACCGLLAIVTGIGARTRTGIASGAVLSMMTMVPTMLWLNPTLTCHPDLRTNNPRLAARLDEGPLARFWGIVRYRMDVTSGQQGMSKFEEYVLRSPADKAAVFVVQGFGRFGPFGPSKSVSEARYDFRQDWGAVLWAPLVGFGIFRSFRSGRQQLREGRPPTSLALLVWAIVSWGVVAGYLPLAWDRYLLPIQAPDAILAAVGLSSLWDRPRRKAVAE